MGRMKCHGPLPNCTFSSHKSQRAHCRRARRFVIKVQFRPKPCREKQVSAINAAQCNAK